MMKVHDIEKVIFLKIVSVNAFGILLMTYSTGMGPNCMAISICGKRGKQKLRVVTGALVVVQLFNAETYTF